MIFYEVDDEFLVGTQAEAKDSKRPWKQVDIPTDKTGLMAYVNALKTVTDISVITPEPDRYVSHSEPSPPTYTEVSIKIDESFEELPLAQQLTLACLALENARKGIR